MSRPKEDIFTRFTTNASRLLGHASIFIIAVGILIVWAASGPFLGFSEVWQLVINTSTTIITFLMVFIIQNTQNRENLALQLKLDKLLEVNGIKSEDLVVAEEKSDKKLETKKKKEQRKVKRKAKR